MARSIKIRWASSHYVYGVDDGVRVRFDVDCAVGLDHRIFAYRMLPTGPGGATAGFFSHICSPVDLAEFPYDAPTPGLAPEWFRLSYVDVLLRSVTEANDFIEIVRSDVRRIVATLAKMDTIFTNGTEVVGTDCAPVDAGSDSSEGSLPSAGSLGSVLSLNAVGTSEQSVGVGVTWSSIGTGAGSPIGSADSFSLNRSRVELQAGESSKLLLVQGFDFSDLPDGAVVEGILSRVTLRDATNGDADHILYGDSLSEDFDLVPTTCPRLSFFVIQHPDLGQSPTRSDNECIGGPNWETIASGGTGDRWDFVSIPAAYLKDGSFSVGIIVHASNTTPTIVEVDGAKLEVFFREEL